MSNSNIRVTARQVMDGKDIDPSEGIVYDHFESRDETTLPNADDILDSVIEILEYINTGEMKMLRAINEIEFEQNIEARYPEFVDRYYSVFKMLISGNDISPLIMMLRAISRVNRGVASLDDVEKDIGKELNKFLPDGLIEKLAADEAKRVRDEQKQRRR